jgi:Zn-finger nucleic acid-binding protein
MAERSGIEIDYCPECRGVWLDRGELDKIIERSSQIPSENTRQQEKYPSKEYYKSDKDYHYKKKKGIWGELFDF